MIISFVFCFRGLEQDEVLRVTRATSWPGSDGSFEAIVVSSHEHTSRLCILARVSNEDYYELDGMIDDFNPYYLLWSTVIEFQRSDKPLSCL